MCSEILILGVCKKGLRRMGSISNEQIIFLYNRQYLPTYPHNANFGFDLQSDKILISSFSCCEPIFFSSSTPNHCL